MGIGLDAWWNDPAYKTCNTFHLRGLLEHLKQHDAPRFSELLSDLYPDDRPAPQDIGKFEWQTILAYMGASEHEIADVQTRMGRRT